MNSEIQLLAFTDPRFDALISGSVSLLGRSAGAAIDAKRLQHTNLYAYLACIGEFQSPESSPDVSLSKFTDHIFATFMIAGPLEIESSIRECGVAVTISRDKLAHFACIASGTLTQWRKAIHSYLLSDEEHFSVRFLFNKLYLAFSFQGLDGLWPPRVQLGDGTFILERT